MSHIQINTFVPDQTTHVRKKRKRKHKRLHFLLKPLVSPATHCRATFENGADHQTPGTQDQPAPPVSSDSLFSSKPSACARSTLSSTSAADDQPNTKPPPAGTSVPAGRCKATPAPTSFPTKYLAIDCEMVGTGPKGSVSQLARCSIVSYEGDVVYDKFIKPTAPVTNYRTRWSGIRHSDLVRATPYAQARKEILKLLAGKVVIGHAVHNDFKVLSYSHPAALTRDTSRIPLLNQKAGFGPAECASLKRLTKAIFNRDIQTGRRGHSSVEDARASMELYRAVEEEWERKLETSRTNRLMEG